MTPAARTLGAGPDRPTSTINAPCSRTEFFSTDDHDETFQALDATEPRRSSATPMTLRVDAGRRAQRADLHHRRAAQPQ